MKDIKWNLCKEKPPEVNDIYLCTIESEEDRSYYCTFLFYDVFAKEWYDIDPDAREFSYTNEGTVIAWADQYHILPYEA